MSESPPQGASSPLWPSVVTAAITCSSFLVGMVAGHKLGGPLRRLVTLAKVGPSKMVLVVQGDLKMGRGKLAAQCSHGALAAYKQAQQRTPSLLQAWEDTGQAKVVVKVDTEKDMLKVVEDAKSKGVPVVSVRDAGRTQVPSGSLTVVAVGPGSLSDVDSVTGHLRLL
ncbi:peptidyl-tRNA hydrolase 2, mitochondrial-like [Portunus trituberculatus]|uniref:peptidyl-tRNA hydrolase 2, mitochondrial-like n=1 Tax=Portunus trituberculatus TaxID=210409 RepID=UPI001E1CD4AA|nr:peptidyl-tRNA hydrolase 2, mitochondrial-like [Portunus trituberculatus]